MLTDEHGDMHPLVKLVSCQSGSWSLIFCALPLREGCGDGRRRCYTARTGFTEVFLTVCQAGSEQVQFLSCWKYPLARCESRFLAVMMFVPENWS